VAPYTSGRPEKRRQSLHILTSDGSSPHARFLRKANVSHEMQPSDDVVQDWVQVLHMKDKEKQSDKAKPSARMGRKAMGLREFY
jgi:hypothetical protein